VRPAGFGSAVDMPVVHCSCLRSAVTGGLGISRRSPLHCASRHNTFFASRRGLVSRPGCLRQQSKSLQHLNVSAIAAPELGTPDAIAGTVCASWCHFRIVCTCCHVRCAFRVSVAANSMALLTHIHIHILDLSKGSRSYFSAVHRQLETQANIRTLTGLLPLPVNYRSMTTGSQMWRE